MFKAIIIVIVVCVVAYLLRRNCRRAWYVLRIGDENPDWEKLGGDYFVASWEKRRRTKSAVKEETKGAERLGVGTDYIYKVWQSLSYLSFGQSNALQLVWFFYPLLRCLVLGEFVGREFAALDVACVDFRKMLPLFGQVVFHKNG
jgi:hypothetical protein